MMFSETLLDHFEHPRHNGAMDAADAEAESENPVCGDRLHVWLRIQAGVVEEMTWQAEGCAPAIAAASVTSELIQGMSARDAGALDRDAISGALGGIPARKLHAAQLSISAVRQALEVFFADQGI